MDTVFSPAPGITPTGQFCWVPTVTGIHQFRVTIQDDGCPLLGQNQYTIVLNVTSCSLDPYVSTTVVGCYDIWLKVFLVGVRLHLHTAGLVEAD
ncbi:MAG: hypothetical protein R3B93_07050 [Bacteroidia bacterium]